MYLLVGAVNYAVLLLPYHTLFLQHTNVVMYGSFKLVSVSDVVFHPTKVSSSESRKVSMMNVPWS
jgi:hypothetical protein